MATEILTERLSTRALHQRDAAAQQLSVHIHDSDAAEWQGQSQDGHLADLWRAVWPDELCAAAGGCDGGGNDDDDDGRS